MGSGCILRGLFFTRKMRARPSAFAKGCNEPRTDLRFPMMLRVSPNTMKLLPMRCKDIREGQGPTSKVHKNGCLIHCTARSVGTRTLWETQIEPAMHSATAEARTGGFRSRVTSSSSSSSCFSFHSMRRITTWRWMMLANFPSSSPSPARLPACPPGLYFKVQQTCQQILLQARG